MEEKVTKKKKQRQRKITKERDTKTKNTFGILQEEDRTIIGRRGTTPIDKIDKDEKKVIKGKGRRRRRKTQSKKKG